MPRKSKKIHVTNPATASEIRKALKISDADSKAALKALNVKKQNKDSFEKLIDKLVDLTNEDQIVWETHMGISRCKSCDIEFTIDNPQDGKPTFYIENGPDKSTITSYKVRDLISAIYDQERRFHPVSPPDPAIKEREIEQKKKCLESCSDIVEILDRKFSK